MRNHYPNIWFMEIQNVNSFLFLKKQLQKPTNFSTFYLTFKGPPPFQYHKVRHPRNLSWKRIVSQIFWQKSREKHYKWYKWNIEKKWNRTARNLKTAYLWSFHFHQNNSQQYILEISAKLRLQYFPHLTKCKKQKALPCKFFLKIKGP